MGGMGKYLSGIRVLVPGAQSMAESILKGFLKAESGGIIALI